MPKISPPPSNDDSLKSPAWNHWFNTVQSALNGLTTVLWSAINFGSSNLTDIVTRNHNDLQNKQGGSSGEYYHLTSAQNTSITSGVSTTITTAKLTALGTNGSMTFTNGILTAHTDAT